MPKLRNAVIFAIILCIIIPVGAVFKKHINRAEENSTYLDIYYFHNNPCEACHEDRKFIDKFNGIVGDDSKGININIHVEDIFKQKSGDLYEYLCDKYEIPREKRRAPAVFIGKSYIQGNSDIEALLGTTFLKEKADFLSKNSNAYLKSPAVGSGKNTQDRDTQTDIGIDGHTPAGYTGLAEGRLEPDGGTGSTIVFFHVTACEDCSKIKNMLEKLKTDYSVNKSGKTINSKVKILSYNVTDPQNLQLSKLYFEVYGVPDENQVIPLLFIGNKYFPGGGTSLEEIESALKDGKGLETPVLTGKKSLQVRAVSLKNYSYAGIAATGFINGLNPCSVSMLLFFFSMLLARGAGILRYGLAFIAGKFIAYLALGTVAYEVFANMEDSWLQNFQLYVKVLLLAVVVILAALNIRDFFAARKENYGDIALQLPAVLRKANHKWIKKFTSLGDSNSRVLVLICFILGMVISAGEFFCTGQIYLTTILYVLKSGSNNILQAGSCFAVYVLAMLVPLIAIMILLQKGRELLELSEAIRVRLPLIKLVNASVFVIFAVLAFIFF